MKTGLLGSVILTLALFASPATAEVEDWYAYWGIGLSHNTYPGALDNAVNAAEALPGFDRMELAIDMLGFYWPLADEKTILGFIISGSADRVFNGSDFFQINQYLYSLSSMHFLGSEPGDGVFIRGDIGLAKALISSSSGPDEVSDTGNGYLIGVGYGLASSEKSRVLFNLNYSHRTIEDEDYSTVGLSIGILW